MKFLVLCTGLAVLPFAVTAQEQEPWNAHFQTTYVWQTKPSLSSPYAGPNSLSGTPEKSYSFTATAAFGIRLLPTTELYFDPEVAQGVPFSGLLGLASFPNGELAKTSGSNPTVYKARLFVRQTFNVGGESTPVESAQNQLATSYNSRRVVITAGTLSVLDLFDANSLAHDPRNQFMNWVLMTHGAYDYAADARGYTNGVAVEYLDNGWAVRAGRFAEPREPNQLKLDGRLGRHYGDQFELERSYEAGTQSGVVRLLAFHSRAVMARYDDALGAAAGTGGVPDLNVVRHGEQSKLGFGADVEHKVSGELGLFARAMRADGKTETYAFTEVDRSVSAGFALRGAAWERSADTLGVAAAVNFLSSSHRAYLQQGGIGPFLGDGALTYGPERLIEAYYSLALGKGAVLTADYQHIDNPGYNVVRGPASFYGLRLHWEN